MKVLIVGSGGREHAIAWKVAQSEKVDKIYCAPGNAGCAEYAECVAIGAMEFDKLVAFAKEKEIDLTVIGMDDPLVGGVVDAFEEAGLRVELDIRNEKIGKKLREARNERVSYICVIGEREAEANTLSVRSTKVGELGEMSADEFVAKLVEEVKTKAI